MKNEFKNKTILVTGGTGSIGGEIVRQLLSFKPKKIRVFARNEHRHHLFKRNLIDEDKCVRQMIGDVRDKDRLRMAMEGVDIVFHAAALKHVDICEDNPFEAVKTNIIGTQNIIELAREFNIEKVIAISTDKAVDPEGALGISKLMAERLILDTFYYLGANKKTKFSCVRFGNVLGSSGSVLEIFRQQIEYGSFVTVTEEKMTRFFMTIGQAVKLLFDATHLMHGHEIFVLKMPSTTIGDLARAVVKSYAPIFNKNAEEIVIKKIGLRRGEKMHEKLLSESELERALETEKMYILHPHITMPGLNYKNLGYSGAKPVKGNAFSSDQAERISEGDMVKLIKGTVCNSTVS